MNPSANTSEQQGEPNWETGNWDQPSSVAGLDSSRPYAGNRLDWDWDNPMILAQHPGGGANDGDADRKSPISGSMASSLRAYTGILSSGFPSNFSQNPMGIFSSSGIRSFAGMDSTSITTSSGLHGAMSSAIIPGIPGLAPTSGGHGDMRSPFEQRRRQYFGVMDPDQKSHANDFHVKRENEVCVGDGHGARIGLNLGVRTYFSTEDTAAGRIGKRHRANSPGSQIPMCQAEGCKADLSNAKHYHRRHKVCELHSKAANVIAAGHTQRFCQQCSRFHLLSEFDEGKRSCRKRLADHNRRRRKPQPATSTTGGPNTESIAMKSEEHDNRTSVSTDPKSMLMHLKKSGSPSSTSMEDSDDKAGSGGSNLQLRTSSAFDRPHNLVLTSQATSMSGPDAQVLLSAMSIAPPVPLLIQNAKRQLSILPGNSQEAAVYQQFLQGVGGGQTGPNLSLSSLGGGSGLSSQLQRSSSEQNFNGIDPPVPWLRPSGSRSDISQVVNRPAMNLHNLIPEKSGPGPNQKVSSAGTTTGGQVYSTSIQNLLPSMQSRDLGGSDWIVRNRDSGTQFGPSGLSNISGQLEGHQFALLENPAAIQEGPAGSGQQGRAVEFLQQHGSDGVDDTRGVGTDLKFPELQGLRPGVFGPSIYDSHQNIL
uniref:SQUAMOSA promoter-binding protein-like protein 1 n=1 Tax=Apopellia endiviifolia (species B) TaxID=119729 RepID=A0A6B7NSX9_9MARC|nr:SQUAMOSA promoter-binding protein-like protein 1 [Apopellia endiviifolia (species B)]